MSKRFLFKTWGKTTRSQDTDIRFQPVNTETTTLDFPWMSVEKCVFFIPKLLSTSTHRHCAINSHTTFCTELTGFKDYWKLEFPRLPLYSFLPVTRHQPSHSHSFPRKQGSRLTQGIRFTVDVSLPVDTAEGKASGAPSSTVPLWCHKPVRHTKDSLPRED